MKLQEKNYEMLVNWLLVDSLVYLLHTATDQPTLINVTRSNFKLLGNRASSWFNLAQIVTENLILYACGIWYTGMT